jgi:hypothetical protein
MHLDPGQITVLAWFAGTVTGFAGGLALGYLWRNAERRSRPVELGRGS